MFPVPPEKAARIFRIRIYSGAHQRVAFTSKFHND